jgi:hypothetical protein
MRAQMRVPGINPTEQQLTPGSPVIRGAMHAVSISIATLVRPSRNSSRSASPTRHCHAAATKLCPSLHCAESLIGQPANPACDYEQISEGAEELGRDGALPRALARTLAYEGVVIR